MASQVLSGSSNVSYTNNTGQNVRIVINYMAKATTSISLSWAGVSASAPLSAIGRNLAFYNFLVSSANSTANNAHTPATILSSVGGENQYAQGALPTELMLAPGQTFTASCGAYNIVVIPEAG